MKIKSKEIKGVIFDIDGTLLDSCSVWKDVDDKFFKRRGLVQPDDYGEAIGHIGLSRAADYTIKRFNLNEKKEDIIKEWKESVILEYEQNIKAKDGAKEFLNYLKENGVKMCAATANDEDCYRSGLVSNGLIDYFDFILEVNSIKKGKDDPEIYFECIRRMGLEKDDVIVFEDLYTAIKCAKDAGFITCAVNDNNKEEEKKKKVADFYISSFKELL